MKDVVKIEHYQQTGIYGIDPKKDLKIHTYHMSIVDYTMFINEFISVYGYRLESTDDGDLILDKVNDVYYYVIKEMQNET